MEDIKPQQDITPSPPNPPKPEPETDEPPAPPRPADDSGQVDELAAVDAKPSETPADSVPPPASTPAPTVAELDQSHNEAALDDPAEQPEVNQAPAPPAKAPKKPSAWLAVVVAVLVALLLVGIGLAAYKASQSGGGETDQTTEQPNQTADDELDSADSEALEQDLNQAESELDQLEADANQDSLDDDSLGL